MEIIEWKIFHIRLNLIKQYYEFNLSYIEKFYKKLLVDSSLVENCEYPEIIKKKNNEYSRKLVIKDIILNFNEEIENIVLEIIPNSMNLKIYVNFANTPITNLLKIKIKKIEETLFNWLKKLMIIILTNQKSIDKSQINPKTIEIYPMYLINIKMNTENILSNLISSDFNKSLIKIKDNIEKRSQFAHAYQLVKLEIYFPKELIIKSIKDENREIKEKFTNILKSSYLRIGFNSLKDYLNKIIEFEVLGLDFNTIFILFNVFKNLNE